jgi:SDR family mycofactocin-dependent oxidoreductase
MAGRVQDKVAFITGVARGQGRSHAVRLAEEGADIIGVDICEMIATNSYPLATEEDLEETRLLVEKAGGRMVARKADVRDRAALASAVADGIAELGHLDVVVANAGILPMGADKGSQAFLDAVEVDLVGVINAISVSLPHLSSGASIIATGSTAGLTPGQTDNPALGPGGAGYSYAKQQVLGFTRALALQVAPDGIRVNAVHPSSVDTHLIRHEDLWRLFRPDVENPTMDDAMPAFLGMSAMPVPWAEPIDVSNMVLFLASEESRYVTGMQMRVDAGAMLKLPGIL